MAGNGMLKEFMNAQDRKRHPLTAGVLDYFPDALLAVANCSFVGNEQHNPGQPLHWAKEKSTDEADALARHLVDRGTYDTDGVRHSAKVAWRALALLQREIDAERAAIALDASKPLLSTKSTVWQDGMKYDSPFRAGPPTPRAEAPKQAEYHRVGKVQVDQNGKHF